ncbi:MAG: glycine cleavage system protein R [Desulfovibrionaceae bacterium]
MTKAVVSFLGRDCPGVMHAVSKALADLGCNILEITQSVLMTEYAAIAIVSLPDGLVLDALRAWLAEQLAGPDMTVVVRPFGPACPQGPDDAEPFVVTLSGPDRLGLIASVSAVLARHGVNIERLKAITLPAPTGQVVIAFEVAVPAATDTAAFRRDLASVATTLAMRANLQHRAIFEAIHRVPPL